MPYAYDAPAVVEDPQVTVSAPSVMSAQDRFDVQVESSDLERVLSADLQVYDGTTLIASLPMTDAGGVLQATIDYDTVKDLDAFTYVVTLSNGVQEASCTCLLYTSRRGTDADGDRTGRGAGERHPGAYGVSAGDRRRPQRDGCPNLP